MKLGMEKFRIQPSISDLKVINGIIGKFGGPDEIVIEVARELKLNHKQKQKYKQRQRENRDNNKRYEEELRKLSEINNYDNRERLKLWEELGSSCIERRCPYTGEQISINKLFNPEVEVDHIIPFARCLDDSLANKTICMRKANRYKRDKTPYEAFGDNPKNYTWQQILDRADHLPANKRARFAPNAANKFANKDQWLARQLNDTAYISRVAREYLTAICNKKQVRVVPGRLTAMFRHVLGLNKIIVSDATKKNRNDHRHHAIDALVIALTDRSMLQHAQTISHSTQERGVEKLLDDFPPPWHSFVEDAKRSVNKIVVSHKPDHGVETALHDDTAYGIVSGPDQQGRHMVTYRKPLASLSKNDFDQIRDENLKNNIKRHIKETQIALKDKDLEDKDIIKEALKNYSQKHNIHRCRLTERLSVIPIRNKEDVAYKAYKGDSNYCYEIYRLETGNWDGEVISSFQANQRPYREFQSDLKRYRRETFSGHPLVMRLVCNDIIAVIDENNRKLKRIVNITLGKVTLVPITEANVDKRHRNKKDSFKYINKAPNVLRKMQARRVFIDPIGQVKDPGFK